MKQITLFFAVFLLVACEKNAPSVYDKQMFAMGTVINVSIYGESEKKSREAFNALRMDFEAQQIAWHPQKEGPLKRLNDALSKQTAFVVDQDLQPMIDKAATLSLASEGLFNPAIGHLINLWGFTQDELPQGPPPSSLQIKTLLEQNPQMSDLKNTPINSAVALNFGAFAKGYAVDKAIEYLQSIGIQNAIVNAGGDLRAMGRKGKKAWVIGIRHPRETGIIASIEIQGDESIFTSGDYERFYDYQSQRYHHILDPRSGYPANQTTSVTVLHKSAATADAAATALFVAGPDHWVRIAKQMSLEQVMLIDKNGKIYLTPQMEKRLSFSNTQALETMDDRD